MERVSHPIMIITLSGTAGSGKTTVAMEVAKRLKLKHHSVGKIMREMAEERDISIVSISRRTVSFSINHLNKDYKNS